MYIYHTYILIHMGCMWPILICMYIFVATFFISMLIVENINIIFACAINVQYAWFVDNCHYVMNSD